MYDAFVGFVVSIDEQFWPPRGQFSGVDSEAVVLGGDVATLGTGVRTRLVVTTVTKPATKTGFKGTPLQAGHVTNKTISFSIENLSANTHIFCQVDTVTKHAASIIVLLLFSTELGHEFEKSTLGSKSFFTLLKFSIFSTQKI